MGEIILSGILCESCGHPIEECRCTCPYCGEGDLCACCIGIEAVTGG